MPAFFVIALFATLSGFGGELDGLRPGHPRLLVGADFDWERFKAVEDPDLASFLELLEANARERFAVPVVNRVVTGRRLLSISRECLRRVLVCSFLYRVNADRAFLKRAEAEMLAAAAFSDWNPSHFLDVAEMCTGLAIGYDWLYSDLSEKSRQTIREAIRDKGLRAGLQDSPWFWTGTNNWNQVCVSGLVLGALAIADEEPELANTILEKARTHNHHGFEAYKPNGVYPEGPNYWNYGSSYSALMIAGLRSAIGRDWGLAEQPGFLASAAFYVQACGPSGTMYNFADGSMSARMRPALFWFAQELGDPGLLHAQRPLIEDDYAVRTRLAPLAALWWPKSGMGQRPKLPLHWSGQGHTPIAIFRESWIDPSATYLGLKGGVATTSHAHMDAGSFVLESQGVRWALDLQQQGYHTIESKGIQLWSMSQDSDRWRIFRLGPLSHSTLTIDGQLHKVDGAATLKSLNAGALVDLSAVFANQAQRVERGFAWRAGREVLIQDELDGLKPGAMVRWAMVTRAEVACNGQRAVLKQSGRTLHAQLHGDAGLVFEAIPADPPDDGISAPNPDTRILIIRAKADESRRVRIGVRLRVGHPPVAEFATRPLSEWR
jgi:oligo-alginate lyase